MRAREQEIAYLFGLPKEYDIPERPVNVDGDGNEWITAENTMKVRR